MARHKKPLDEAKYIEHISSTQISGASLERAKALASEILKIEQRQQEAKKIAENERRKENR